jgi:DNA-binding NtrC family response regulator
LAAGVLIPTMICSNTRPLLHRSEDLVFADVRLRGVMEGIDLARKVKMRWPLLPVILTSGHPREGVGELPPGVAYMRKPWQLNVLIAPEQALASQV